MQIITKKLTDSFNSNNMLAISMMEQHDMYVATGEENTLKMGPDVRIHNFMGSGNADYDSIYMYLFQLATHYGRDIDGQKNLKLTQSSNAIGNGQQVMIPHDHRKEEMLKIISTSFYFGFQTLSNGDKFKKDGPIVWIDKKLPGILREMKSLEKSIRASGAEPFELKVA